MDYMIILIAFIPILVISTSMPYATRRTESFGISIPEEFYYSNELKAMRKKYAWQTAGLGVILTVAWLLIIWLTTIKDPAYITMLFVFMIGWFLIFLLYRRRMKVIKARENWHENRREIVAVDIGFRNQKVGVSIGWYMVPFGIAIVTFILTFIFYDQLPKRFPMQYDFDGNVTTWATKSYRTAFQPPIIQLYFTALLLFINMKTITSKQLIDAAQPEVSATKNRIYRHRWSTFIFLTATLFVLLFGLIQLNNFGYIHTTLVMILSITIIVSIIIGAIVLMFTTGQGGSRIKIGEAKQQKIINRDDDQYWKLGVFYFNPNDPAIWVDKRFGIGWTVNFAHPLAWGALILIFLPIILIVTLM